MLKNILKKQRLKYPILTNVVLEKIYLFEKLDKGRITASEAVRLSFLIGMINENQYNDYLRIEEKYSLFE